MKALCIYHGNCADGFTAAWVVRRALGDDVEFHAGIYGEPPPEVSGRNVVMVDFSYTRPVLEAMIGQAASVLILDHHKTAAADLDGLPGAQTVFDMERSGARIAWDHYFPSEAPPALLLHVEDRDLWRFALPQTREIQANVFSHPYDFAVWDMLMATDPAELAREGAALERKHFKDIAELLTVVTRPMRIGGHVVDVANLPYTFTSDAGSALARGKPFGACYWDTPQGRSFSLRSTDAGEDVSAIARLYGGGGHRNAAGFRVSFEQAREFEIGEGGSND
jgi:oligoribonuclease NrnB/cAMP/cGMP phosphodiesterase (DHH superfamily)